MMLKLDPKKADYWFVTGILVVIGLIVVYRSARESINFFGLFAAMVLINFVLYRGSSVFGQRLIVLATTGLMLIVLAYYLFHGFFASLSY